MTENKRFTSDIHRICDNNEEIACADTMDDAEILVDRLNEQYNRIKELETDVEYWKQVASQYSNELNVFEHCKKYKTECKDIYWDSD